MHIASTHHDPPTARAIKEGAFSNCYGLTNVTLNMDWRRLGRGHSVNAHHYMKL